MVKKKNIAVILSGGTGSRLKTSEKIPKQYLKVAGKSIIEHTIEVFQNHNLIDEIAIVANPNYHEKIAIFLENNNFSKVKKILHSGDTRNSSSLSAIEAYKNIREHCNLIFHDAVRPLVSAQIITNCIKALNKYSAVDVAIPATDTIIQKHNNDDSIDTIPNRELLLYGQTPQAFHFEVIEKAYNIALKDPKFKATDDCGVISKYLPLETIHIVEGSMSNIKITHKEDLALANILFQLKTSELLKNATDTSFENQVVVIFGGNSGIGLALKNMLLKKQAKVYTFSRTDNNIDISNLKEVENSLEKVAKAEGKIHHIIVASGILQISSLNNMNMEDITKIINVNYLGSINVAKSGFKYLKETRGNLVFFTSSSYTKGRANYSIYSSTKAAIVNLTQALADEWSIHNIKVNCINPERTNTPMRKKNFGIEDPTTLLDANKVAEKTLMVLSKHYNLSGCIIDVTKNN